MFTHWFGRVCACVCACAPLFCCFDGCCFAYCICKCAPTLLYLIKYTFLTRTGQPEVRWSIVSSLCLHNQHILSVSSFKMPKSLCRFQWPRGLRRESTSSCLLGLRVRNPLGAWMFVYCEFCVQLADHSSRGVLPAVLYHCVWSSNLTK